MTASLLNRCIAMPFAPEDWAFINTSIIFDHHPAKPVLEFDILPASNGEYVQPKLRMRISSRGHSRIASASTAATAIGLLDHVPPSMFGTNLSERKVGKYIGA